MSSSITLFVFVDRWFSLGVQDVQCDVLICVSLASILFILRERLMGLIFADFYQSTYVNTKNKR